MDMLGSQAPQSLFLDEPEYALTAEATNNDYARTARGQTSIKNIRTFNRSWVLQGRLSHPNGPNTPGVVVYNLSDKPPSTHHGRNGRAVHHLFRLRQAAT